MLHCSKYVELKLVMDEQILVNTIVADMSGEELLKYGLRAISHNQCLQQASLSTKP